MTLKNLFNKQSAGKACAITAIALATTLNVTNIWHEITQPDHESNVMGGQILFWGGLAGFCLIKRKENNIPKP